MTPTNQKYALAIESHYSRNWPIKVTSTRWTRGPVHELPSEFRISVFRAASDMLAYATVAMSQPEDAERVELHLFDARETVSDELVELLTVAAHFHRNGERLGLGHTVNFGRPWRKGSNCTHGLLSLPYVFGPKLEWLDKPRVRFLWLIPITAEEQQFKKEHGLEALERLFDSAGFNYLDPMRASVLGVSAKDNQGDS
jgi:Suppressor of fused protein (SUFU)